MARPHKETADQRSFMLRTRLTGSEKSRLDALAKEAGFTTSDHVRKLVLGNIPTRNVPNPDRELLLKLLAELHKLGSNVNQIARALNVSLKKGQPFDVPEHVLTSALYGVDTVTRFIQTTLKDGRKG